jgi:hypothetical protein
MSRPERLAARLSVFIRMERFASYFGNRMRHRIVVALNKSNANDAQKAYSEPIPALKSRGP